MGRISKNTRVLDSTTYVTTSVYDGLGRLKEATYPTSPAKTVEYLYTGPVLDKVQDKAGSGTTIYATYSNYTSQAQAQTITYGNGVVTTSTFADPAHTTCIPANSFKLCTLKTQKGTNRLYQDLTYTFTADGNMDLITDPINGNQDFGYDALDRLISATGPYDSGATITRTYSYNEIGNILTNSWLTAGTYTYPTSGAGVVRPHAATVVGTYPLTYDNNGNMVTLTDPAGFYGYSATYNVDNRLSSVVTTYAGVPTTSTFVYDGDGGRVKKIVGTTTRYISKLYECDTTGANTSCRAGSSGQFECDHRQYRGQGSGPQLLSLWRSSHKSEFTTPAVDVPYKYTGKELDTASNLYFYESRYYHPIFGRFISPDTLVARPGDPQDLNRYTYARNNPLIYTDPTGHFFKKLFKNPFLRALGWVVNPMMMQFLDPATQKTAIAGTVGAGVTVVTGGCAPCGGAAAGALGAALGGQDVGRGAWIGAASATVGWGVGNVTSSVSPSMVSGALGTVAGGATGGALSAATGGGNILQSIAIGAGTSLAWYAVMEAGNLASSSAGRTLLGQASLDRTALAVDQQASNPNGPILMAQKGGSVRESPLGRAAEGIVDQIDETNAFYGDIRQLKALGQINSAIGDLRNQIPAGQSRMGHFFIDRFTGDLKGAGFERRQLWDSDTIHYQEMIHGPSGPPQFRQGH